MALKLSGTSFLSNFAFHWEAIVLSSKFNKGCHSGLITDEELKASSTAIWSHIFATFCFGIKVEPSDQVSIKTVKEKWENHTFLCFLLKLQGIWRFLFYFLACFFVFYEESESKREIPYKHISWAMVLETQICNVGEEF